jgi:hypothetical protein
MFKLDVRFGEAFFVTVHEGVLIECDWLRRAGTVRGPTRGAIGRIGGDCLVIATVGVSRRIDVYVLIRVRGW